MKEAAMSILAKILALPWVFKALVWYAKKRPYYHLQTPTGETYMERYWVFNPFNRRTGKPRFKRWPSIRLHWIKREDMDNVPHDHPWNARTFILSGWYEESRVCHYTHDCWVLSQFCRRKGQTATLDFGQFHRIDRVSEGGVWTLFVTGEYQGTWGFLEDGVKTPWREYLQKQGYRDTASRPSSEPTEGEGDAWPLFEKRITSVRDSKWPAPWNTDATNSLGPDLEKRVRQALKADFSNLERRLIFGDWPQTEDRRQGHGSATGRYESAATPGDMTPDKVRRELMGSLMQITQGDYDAASRCARCLGVPEDTILAADPRWSKEA